MDCKKGYTTQTYGPHKLSICRSAGFCFGVGRAVDMAMRLTKEKQEVYCLGSLVHNSRVLDDLARRGMRVISDLAEAPPDAHILIRSHGVSKELSEALQGRAVTDATCPCIKRIHNIVCKTAAQNSHILLLGDPEHPEVRATASWCRSVDIFDSRDALEKLSKAHPEWSELHLIVIAQTTASLAVWEECVDFLKKVYTNAQILDTICRATSMRQQEAAVLSAQTNVMLVVGDRKSSNTKHLVTVCRRAVLIQSADDLNPRDYLGGSAARHIGITAGASTPASTIKEVVHKMSEEMKKAEQAAEAVPSETETPIVAAGGESFEEMLEASLKTLISGDKVTGVITRITPTEIQVELGTKHAGYIPIEELSDESPEKVAETLKAGDEIETYVVRVNDVEGTAMLSKKRLDTVKSWETVEGASGTQQVLEGTVVEENKGGVVVSVKGVRVFVPSSQTGLPREVPMSSLLKSKVQLRVTEFNRARRRVVGSIRSVLQETRRAQSEAIWENIEVGKRYTGFVKSLTSYGAFVDIGGIDGMVHISELSWKRVKQPSEVLSLGDNVEVYVLSFDREKKKISLGYRKQEDNPWNIFTKTFNVGDVFSTKVVRLMAFGAFCEVLPGVDGLIHISQLSDRRVGKPSDVVKEGDTVTVKLMEIDQERKKISLSIRALMEEPGSLPDDDREDEIVATSDEGGKTVIAEGLTESDEPVARIVETPETLQDKELNNIAGAVADAVAEVAREEAAEQAAASEIPVSEK